MQQNKDIIQEFHTLVVAWHEISWFNDDDEVEMVACKLADKGTNG